MSFRRLGLRRLDLRHLSLRSWALALVLVLGLWQIGEGLWIQRADGSWVDYVVREIQIVDGRTARLPLIGNGPPLLALTTCYPFDAVMPGGPLRLVVLAEGVSTTAAR
jgi:sortase A